MDYFLCRYKYVAPLAAILLLVISGVLPARNSVARNNLERILNFPSKSDQPSLGKSPNQYGSLPLSFEANQGQTNPAVKFLARGNSYGLFLTSKGPVLSLSRQSEQANGEPSVNTTSTAVVSFELRGGSKSPRIFGVDELPGKANYFNGSDPSKWRRNVSTFSKVRYSEVYPGIDVIYYGNQRQLEYDFVVNPGKDPSRIELAITGAKKITVDANDYLVLSTAAGEIKQAKPVAYQEINGERREVPASYRIAGDAVGFSVGDYDKSKPLVIDPVLVYSSYLGGSTAEQGLAIAVDAQGNAYLTGRTNSTNFPTANPFQAVRSSSLNDVFVTKVNAAGNGLVFSTYIGGTGSDMGRAIAVDSQGSAYVAGSTFSTDFPTTAGALQTAKDTGGDGFVTKLSSSGSSLVYSTYVGGNTDDTIFGIALGGDGKPVVAGVTHSTRFKSNVFPIPRGGSAVYQSVDKAANWSAGGTGLTADIVNNFGLDPSNANNIYAASNFGVFKSVDAGANWNLTGTASPATAPALTYEVLVDPSNPSTVYAGTISGVFKSTDGGSSYQQKINGMLGAETVETMAIDPATPMTVYAGTFNGVYKTTDGGNNWSPMNNGWSIPLVREIVINPSNPAIIYAGTSDGMYKSTNGGGGWGSINSGAVLLNHPEISALAIDPLNPSILYAAPFGPPERMLRTTDGGTTWSVISTGLGSAPSLSTLAVDPATPTTLYVSSNGAGVFKTTDSGGHWAPSNAGLTRSVVNTVAVHPNNTSILFAGTSVGGDGFAAKLNASGSALDYLFNFGGDGEDSASAIALEADGNAYLTGFTASANFPTVNAFQPARGDSFGDAFVAKLNPAGTSFVYSTYLGGNSSDQASSIAVHNGNAYVVGTTSSPNFPLLSPIKSILDPFDTDVFVTRFNANGSALDFSSYVGGSNFDQALSIAVDSAGSAYVTGLTFSNDFPTLLAPQNAGAGASDGFVFKLNAADNQLAYSTYLGGSNSDQGNGIAVDGSGNAYVVGTTSSTNFPTASPFQATRNGSSDAFFLKLGSAADLSITETDSRDPVLINTSFTYSLIVNNGGPSPATGVVVADTLPAGLNFNAATTTQGTCSFSNPTITCNLGGLAVSAAAVIEISVTPTATGTVTNTATVNGNEPDPNSGNNSASQSTRISSSPSISGHVKDSGNNGVSGVLMTLSGTRAGTMQTDNNGFYQFADLPFGGNYTVSPSKTNLSFDPESQVVNTLNTDQTTDFLASTCTYGIAPTTQSFSAAGGAGSVTVTSLHGCPWTAVSSVNWLTITSGAAGAGNGVVNFSVSPTSVPRVAHLTIAGKIFTVYQEANSCGAPSFSVSTYNLSYNPTVVRVADLNGDGNADAALVTNGLSGSGIQASVMLNDGTGAFMTSQFDTGLGIPQGFVVADFNGDGRPDIAITTYNTPLVRIFFNNGSGGFGASYIDVPFTTPGQSPFTRGLLTSDLNRDGKADLIVSAPDGTAAQILLGNGSGGFTQLSSVSAGAGFVPIDLADFNGDGIPDLLFVTNQVRPIAVMLGNGSGGFAPAVLTGGIDTAGSTRVGDFDGDGILDLVVRTTISTGSSTFTGFVIMAGDGSGHFIEKTRYAQSIGSQLSVADFNSDGKTDIAFTSGGTNVTILLGDGAGGLANPIVVDTGGNPSHPGNFGIQAADFTGDGKPDLITANYTIGAEVLRNNCAGTPAISGRVTDSTTSGVAGITITVNGTQSATTTTDSSGNYLIGNLTAGGNYTVTPSRDNFRFNPANVSINGLAGTQTANFVSTPITVQFSPTYYLVEENAGSVRVDVTRSGDLSGTSTVDYTTINGTASDRSDYTPSLGTLRFGPGEALKSFSVLLTDDALVEGYESLTLKLSNPTGAVLSTSHGIVFDSAAMEIHDNDTNPNGGNPVDVSSFFVRQHYHDFLNREPDQSGLNFWTGEISQCGSNAQCTEVKRINVSAAFFLSIEFQETGYLVERLYKTAYGNASGTSTIGGSHQVPVPIIRLNEFLPDSQEIGRGLVVGAPGWEQVLENNKVAFILQFVQRSRFTTAFPISLTPAQFVDQLFARAGVTPSASERTSIINEFSGVGTSVDNAARGRALRRVAENSTLNQAEKNKAFVLMQFFGYLRRNPNDPQDTDYTGYDFWLSKLNEFNGDFIRAEMVKAFLDSTEYRARFGP